MAIKKKLSLEFDVHDLPEATRAAMATCLQTESMSEWELWASVDAVMDTVGDGQFDGLSLPEGFSYTKTSLSLIPKEWWKAMAFPKPMERAMKAFWKKNPEGSIYWS